MLPKQDAVRAHNQDALWNRLNAKASSFSDGPVELESIATWLKGTGEDQAVGILLQELIGRAFESSYKETQESWAAAVTLDAAIRMKNPLKRDRERPFWGTSVSSDNQDQRRVGAAAGSNCLCHSSELVPTIVPPLQLAPLSGSIALLGLPIR